MDDLYPKVTNYFFVPDTSGTDEENKRDMLNRMLPCGAVVFLITLLTGLASGDNIILVLFAAVLGGLFGGAILGWLLMLVSVLGSVGSQAGDTLGMGFNVFGSSGKFKKKMQQYSPEFSYEYFTAKVISLAKMLIFTKNVEELPVYTGDAKGELFPDIIDATKIKSCPSCGTMYEIGDDDWVVTHIEKK